MISGITAASAPSTTGAATSLGSIDFVNGVYTWGETSLTAGDVVDQTGWITSSGLEVPGSGSAGAEILYAPLTALLAACQWTIVFEIETLTNVGRFYIMTETNSGESFYIEVSYWDHWDLSSGDGSGFPYASDEVNGLTLGVHRAAFTRIDNKSSISIDGNDVVTDTTACVLPVDGFPMVNFYLGGYSTYTGQAGNIRAITVYDAQEDAHLPALSA